MKDKEINANEFFKRFKTHLEEKGINYQTKTINGSISLKIIKNDKETTRIVFYQDQVNVSSRFGYTGLPLTEYSYDFLIKVVTNE